MKAINKNPTPDIMYGRLKESVHISGYSLERAMGEFNWLLENDRWKTTGTGYNDINEFLKTFNFSWIKIGVQNRREIALKLARLQASQRATARMLGVCKDTIRRDLSCSVPNAPPKKTENIDNQYVENKR